MISHHAYPCISVQICNRFLYTLRFLNPQIPPSVAILVFSTPFCWLKFKPRRIWLLGVQSNGAPFAVCRFVGQDRHLASRWVSRVLHCIKISCEETARSAAAKRWSFFLFFLVLVSNLRNGKYTNSSIILDFFFVCKHVIIC